MVIAEQMAARSLVKRGRRSIVIPDENWDRLDSPHMAPQVEQSFRTARANNASIWGISQAIEDYTGTPERPRPAGPGILNSAAIKWIREAQTYLNAKLRERDIGRLPRLRIAHHRAGAVINLSLPGGVSITARSSGAALGEERHEPGIISVSIHRVKMAAVGNPSVISLRLKGQDRGRYDAPVLEAARWTADLLISFNEETARRKITFGWGVTVKLRFPFAYVAGSRRKSCCLQVSGDTDDHPTRT